MAQDLTVALNTELANRMGQTDFLENMRLLSAYELQVSNIQVTNDQEYQLGVDSLVAIAAVNKAFERIRKESVAYSNLYTKTVNDTFRGLKQRGTRVQEKLSYHTQKFADYKAKLEEREAQKAAEEAARQVEGLPFEGQDAAEVAEVSEGVNQVTNGQEGEPPPTPPIQPTKTTDGQGSVSYRKGPPKIEVTNAAKLVRAAVNEKNKVPVTIVTIDAKALRKAVDAGIYTIKQWARYGVEVTETKQQVVRT